MIIILQQQQCSRVENPFCLGPETGEDNWAETVGWTQCQKSTLNYSTRQ